MSLTGRNIHIQIFHKVACEVYAVDSDASCRSHTLHSAFARCCRFIRLSGTTTMPFCLLIARSETYWSYSALCTP